MSSNITHSMSKQAIINRMLRFATKYWGVKRIELLDPVTTLFIEALAEEIYSVSSEIGNIETRMLNTLTGLIVPDISLSAHPAHCIMHALPQDGRTILSDNIAFTLKNKELLPSRESLTFYPLRNTVIHSGGIRYMTFNGLLYQIDIDQSKTLISRSRNNTRLSQNIWIGIELDETTPNLKDLSFYIDFPNIPNKDELLHLLPHSIWKLNGNRVTIKQGLHTVEDDQINETVNIFDNLTTASNLDNSIWNSYNKYFLTITDSIIAQGQKIEYPNELKASFSSHVFEDFTKPIIWFEIEFPTKINTTMLENILITINAFPIINKNLHTKTAEVHESLPIIPLDTGNHESLLSIDSVSDSQGRIYNELPFTDTDTESFGTYSLRRGGYERYSKREMREYLLALVKQIESLSSVNDEDRVNENDISNNSTIEIHKLINHIKYLIIKSKEKLDIQYYISIDCLKKSDVFFIKYRTTNCELANNIKQHTIFYCTDTDISLNPLSLFTLSATDGGKSIPSVANIQNLQIKALTTQSILVTNNDIIEYCNKSFGSIISQVEVTKGVMENPNNKQEFLCTKDVLLTPNNDNELQLKDSDIDFFLKNLKANSPETFNYRIIVSK